MERTSGHQKASFEGLLEGKEEADSSHESQEVGGSGLSLRGSEEEGEGGSEAMPGAVTVGFIKGT